MSIKNVPFGGEGGSTDSRIINTGRESEYWLPAGIAEVVIIEKNKTGVRQHSVESSCYSPTTRPRCLKFNFH